MFQQVAFADWSTIVTIAAFVASASIFTWVVVAAIRYPADKIRRLSELPLEKEKRS